MASPVSVATAEARATGGEGTIAGSGGGAAVGGCGDALAAAAGEGAGKGVALAVGTAGVCAACGASHAGDASRIGVCSPAMKKSVLVGSERSYPGGSSRDPIRLSACVSAEGGSGGGVAGSDGGGVVGGNGGGAALAGSGGPPALGGSGGGPALAEVVGGGGVPCSVGFGAGIKRCGIAGIGIFRAMVIVSSSSPSSSSRPKRWSSGIDRMITVGIGSRSPPIARSSPCMSCQVSGCRAPLIAR